MTTINCGATYVVADRDKADFEIKGTAEMKKAGWAKTIWGTGRPAVNASIQVINIKTSIGPTLSPRTKIMRGAGIRARLSI